MAKIEFYEIIFALVFIGSFVSGVLVIFNKNERETDRQMQLSFLKKKSSAKQVKLTKKVSFLDEKKMFVLELLRKSEKSKKDFVKLLILFFACGFGVGMFFFSSILLAVATGITFVPMAVLWLFFKTQEVTRAEISELESAMSIITNSYLANNDVLKSFTLYIEERDRHLPKELKRTTPFDEFVAECVLINPSVDKALVNLSKKIKNSYFRDWVKNLRLCIENKEMRFSLKPVIDAMQDEKILQIESDAQMKTTWFTYLSTVALTFSVLLVFKFVQDDWYAVLVYTPIGKLIVLLMLLTTLITAAYVAKINKPIGSV